MTTEAIAFSAENMERFKHALAKYEVPDSALLPTLYLAQEQFGFLSPPVMEYVAKLLGMPPVKVFEAATFYVMFKKKDMGRWCLQVCNNITCTMMGAEKLNKVIKDELKIGPNEVTSDGMFSYLPAQCLGSCDTAPVCQVNEEYVESLDPEKFRKLLKGLRQGEPVLAPEASLQ